LTGYELDIESDGGASAAAPDAPAAPAAAEAPAAPAAAAPKKPGKIKKKSELESSLLEAIEEHGE
jgi:hypothetical protein